MRNFTIQAEGTTVGAGRALDTGEFEARWGTVSSALYPSLTLLSAAIMKYYGTADIGFAGEMEIGLDGRAARVAEPDPRNASLEAEKQALTEEISLYKGRLTRALAEAERMTDLLSALRAIMNSEAGPNNQAAKAMKQIAQDALRNLKG